MEDMAELNETGRIQTINQDVKNNLWYNKANSDIPNIFRRYNVDTHRGNYELYCREFSYSTIFGNLRTGNLPTILKLVEISKLPNIMFLIQIDDHHNFYTPYPEFSYFPYRSNVVLAIQAKLEDMKIESVVSRFLGHETIGAYLCLDGRSISDAGTRNSVRAVAAEVIEHVYNKTGECISVGVSDFCSSLTQFPRAYSECKTALTYAFYSGRQSIEIYDKQKPQPGIAKQDLSHLFFTRYLTYINDNDTESCRETAVEMIGKFRKANLAPITARLLVSGFIARVVDYFVNAGHDVDALTQTAQDSIVDLFNCNFLDDFPGIITHFCEKLGKQHGGLRQSPDERFRRYTNDCIERHSSDCLFDFSVIASMHNYSPSYFSRLFTRIYGVPFSQYLASYRIERAKKLLMQESMTLQEVAQKTGFCSTSYFCSVFKKKTGKSPRQYASDTNARQGGYDHFLDEIAIYE